nr:hypothetical protein [Tanacetum cinerariifolium]
MGVEPPTPAPMPIKRVAHWGAHNPKTGTGSKLTLAKTPDRRPDQNGPVRSGPIWSSVSDWSFFLHRHPRGGAEQSQFTSLLSHIGTVSLKKHNDSWVWSLDTSNVFSVAPRLMLNKLPTRVNLDSKGIDVGSILCLICSEDVESANHIFFSCEMAKDLWALFARWWELDIPVFDNFSEWVAWLKSSHLSNKAKLFLEGVGGLSYGLFGVFEI